MLYIYKNILLQFLFQHKFLKDIENSLYAI